MPAIFVVLLSILARPSGDAPVHIWLGRGPLAPGDAVRVYVATDADGYLVVLHRRTDGRVEVLSPEDPASDAFAPADT